MRWAIPVGNWPEIMHNAVLADRVRTRRDLRGWGFCVNETRRASPIRPQPRLDGRNPFDEFMGNVFISASDNFPSEW